MSRDDVGRWVVVAAVLALSSGGAGGAEAGPTALEKPAEAARLCQALQPSERAAAGAEAQARAREEAMGRRYRVDVSGDGLDFEPWTEETGLRLSPRAVFVGVGRSMRLWMPDADDLAVKIPKAAAQRVFQAKARARLSLRLTFEIPSGEPGEAPCMRAAGGKSWILAIEPVSWEYLAGSQVLARGGEGEGPTASATEGARPRVSVGEAVGEAATSAVRSALQGKLADLTACYRQALERNPRLDGTLVVEVTLTGKGGPPKAARIAADSAQEDALAACIQGVAAKTQFPAGRAGAASMAVQLELGPEP